MTRAQAAYSIDEFGFNQRIIASVRPSTISKIATYLGENEDTVKATVHTLLPALSSFLDLPEQNLRDLSKMASLITSYRESLGNFNINNLEIKNYPNLSDIGTNDLLDLYGTRISALLNNISQISGLKEESVFTLLALITPHLLKQLGTFLPKGKAFSPTLLNLIKDNREDFQELIRSSKPTPGVKPEKLDNEHTLLPYFLILTISSFFIFNGLSYLSREELPSLLISSKSSYSSSSIVDKLKLGIRNFFQYIELEPEDSINNKIEIGGDKAIDQEVDINDENFSISFNPKEIKESTSLKQEINEFLKKSTGYRLRSFHLDKVHFKSNDSKLSDEAILQLKEVSTLLAGIEDLHIEVAVHTDSSHSEESNKLISKERSLMIKKILVDNNIPENSIQAVGYGSQKPLSTNSTTRGRDLNKRVELLLTMKLMKN